MNPEEVKDRIYANPVIAAVKEEKDLEEALETDLDVIFLLGSTLLDLDNRIRRIHEAGKAAVVHFDLVEGLGSREVAVDFLKRTAAPDGIISTRPAIVKRAKADSMLAIQRAFILDSLSIRNLEASIQHEKPDFIEILPGILPKIITEIRRDARVPVIAGGLIREKDEVLAALKAGAAAVSTSSPAVWKL